MSRKYLITENEFESIRVEGRDLVATRDNGTPVNFGQVVPDISPEMQQLLDDTEAARDQAEVFAANTVELQDTAVAQLIDTPGSETQTQLNATIVNVASGIIPTDVVTSPQIRRIVSVPAGEPLPPLQENDLVVRYEPLGNSFYKDFSDDDEGGAQPTGMTHLVGLGDGVRSGSAGSENTDGKVLRFLPSNGTAAYAITAATTDPFAEQVEFLVRWKRHTDHGLSIFLYVDQASDSYYRVGYNTVSGAGRLRITPRLNGVNLATTESPTPTADGSTWQLMRVRLAAGFIRAKSWPATDPEPAEWPLSRDISSLAVQLPSGPSGVGSYDQSVDVDWVVTATGGKVAVKP